MNATTPTVLEKPIPFKAPMVRAILDGSKTQTRRVIKPQPNPTRGHFQEVGCSSSDWQAVTCDDGEWSFISTCADDVPIGRCPHPVSSLAWVRETFYNDNPDAPESERDPMDLYFRADGDDLCRQIPECDCAAGKPTWKPSIFLPRWASRITLEITGVRVERLQSISEVDAKAEGVEPRNNGVMDTILGPEPTKSYRTGFVYLWDSINRKTHPWASNPWVWVYEFKRIKP